MWSPETHSSMVNGPVPTSFRLYAQRGISAGSPVACLGMIAVNRLTHGAFEVLYVVTAVAGLGKSTLSISRYGVVLTAPLCGWPIACQVNRPSSQVAGCLSGYI